MTIQEAYYKLFNGKYAGYYSSKAYDIDDLFVFFPTPIKKATNKITRTGAIFPAVDKKTGEIVEFNILDHDIKEAKVIQFKFKR